MTANGVVCICAFICVHLWSVLIHEFTQMVTQMVANGLVCISALICEHLWKRLCGSSHLNLHSNSSVNGISSPARTVDTALSPVTYGLLPT
jgi:hypothetical protein